MPRAMWTEEKISALLVVLLNSYEVYKPSKRMGKLLEFYREVGEKIGMSGPAVENFLKNIGREYRDTLLKRRLSSCGDQESTTIEQTPSKPRLRDSEHLYALYEQYQQVYYAKGTNIRSALLNLGLLTDNHVIVTPTMLPPTGDAGDGNSGGPSCSGHAYRPPSSSSAAGADVKQETDDDDIRSASDSATSVCKNGDDPPSERRRRSRKRRHNDEFLLDSWSLQERHLQLLARQNELIGDLTSEVRMLRVALFSVLRVDMTPP